MLIVHAFATPNSIKVLIALEELGLEYQVKSVNVRKGEQKSADFLSINPNGKVPVLIDDAVDPHHPFTLTESAAILVHLAEREGQLLPLNAQKRARVFEQLFFHGSGLGPAFGQSGFFLRLPGEPIQVAIDRFHTEAKRNLALLEGVLANSPFVAGSEYTIADIAHFGWLWRREFAGIDFSSSPNVARWYQTLSERPAIVKAIAKAEALIPAT
ncbi:glutathione S-transferase family protein [Pseudomonas sp. RC10]|uniref:glutathione S-transferase family protein n=1 Tax=Pseudomonas bambusae TaxID=3139142 RepID=UPI003138D5C0